MTNSDAIREFAEVITQQILTYLRAEACFIGEFENEIRKKIEEQFTARISEHYYPKKFVRWMFQGCPFIIGENGAGNIIAFSVRDGKQFTFDELFNYWKENEQEEHPTNKEKFDRNYLPDPE